MNDADPDERQIKKSKEATERRKESRRKSREYYEKERSE